MARRHVRDPNASARSRRNSDLISGHTGEIDSIIVAGGVVEVGRTLTPREKTDKLYNVGGDLKWNGLSVTEGGVTTIDGLTDVDTSGAASAHILVFGGTTWDSTAVSGDVTMASSGAVSIRNDRVDESHINWGVDTGQVNSSQIPIGPAVDSSHDLGFKGDAGGTASSKTNRTWTTSTTTVTALDDLNEILGLLVPAKPSDLGALSLSMGSTGLYNPRLCRNTVPDNTGGGSTQTPGTAVPRITGGSGTTTACNDAYNGEAGTVSLTVNGSSVVGSSRAMTSGNDNGTYGQIVVSDNKWFDTGESVTGSNTGFWQSYDVHASPTGLSSVGVHRLKIVHTGLDDTETDDTYFCNDTMTAAPVMAVDVGGDSITVTTPGSLPKSSGISHYSNDAVLAVARTTMTNVANTHYIYLQSPVVFSDTSHTYSGGYGSGNCLASVNKTYDQVGVTNDSGVVDYNQTSAHTLTSQSLSLNGTNSFCSRRITVRGYNVNGNSSATYTGRNILYKQGTVPNYLPNEDAVIVDTGVGTGSTNASRITIGTQGGSDNDGDSPSVDNWDGAADDWNSATAIPTSFDAAIVGGILRHDATDYSDGWLPPGTDFSAISNRSSDIQYITFRFNRTAVSKFDIELAGEIHATAGCEVALPGSSIDTSATATNGWLTPMIAYGGSGLPTRGCGEGGVMSHSNSTATRYTVTFGTENSTNADPTGTILVRFKLASGDYLKHLRFRTASN